MERKIRSLRLEDGIDYIQWPLGYFREATLQCACVVEHGPLLVFDTSLRDEQQKIAQQPQSQTQRGISNAGFGGLEEDAAGGDPRTSKKLGIPKDRISKHVYWSNYYATESRRPDTGEPLASWTERRLRQMLPRGG